MRDLPFKRLLLRCHVWHLPWHFSFLLYKRIKPIVSDFQSFQLWSLLKCCILTHPVFHLAYKPDALFLSCHMPRQSLKVSHFLFVSFIFTDSVNCFSTLQFFLLPRDDIIPCTVCDWMLCFCVFRMIIWCSSSWGTCLIQGKKKKKTNIKKKSKVCANDVTFIYGVQK